ncbi:hypothetical protein ES703_35695 [subsurface metagenome]
MRSLHKRVFPALGGLLPWIGGADACARDNFYYIGVDISKKAAPFACVVCKVQGWESVGLQVAVMRSAIVVCPSGCPEVSPGDPRREISPVSIEKTGWNGSVRSDTESFKRCSQRSEGFPLDLQTFEARISPRIDYLALVSTKVFGKRCVSRVRWPVA